jgi:hypothetical protein
MYEEAMELAYFGAQVLFCVANVVSWQEPRDMTHNLTLPARV